MERTLKMKIYLCMEKFQNFRVIVAVKKGFVITIPLTIIGCMCLVLQYFPDDNYQKWISSIFGGLIGSSLTICNKACVGFLSFCLVISISFAYIQICDKKLHDVIAMPIISVAAYLILIDITRSDFSIDEFNSTGMFIALVSAVISCELYLAIVETRLIKKEIDTTGVDTLFAGVIKSILPAVVILIIAIVVRQGISKIYGDSNIQKVFADLVQGVFDDARRNLKTIIVYIILVHLLWMVGIHGNNVLGDVSNRLIAEGTNINIDLVSKGKAPTEIITKPVIDSFVIMGGTGTVLCIIVAVFLFIKKKNIRTICKFGCVPVFFNISEIITFGLPIVLNPILFIPFIFVPVVCLLITYFSMYFGLVPLVIRDVYWTTPIIFSGYKATGSIRGAILQVILVLIGVAIYYPFLKLHVINVEKTILIGVNQLQEELIKFENFNKESDFLDRNDRIGEVAKMLAGDLKYDLEHGKLFMAYQPQVDYQGRYIGAEALIRWKHSSVGYIYPPLIIALAKEAKILHRIEKMILMDVCTNIKYLEEHYRGNYKISANITAESLRYEKFEEMVEQAVEISSIDRKNLWFEITEREAVTSNEGITEKLFRLKEKGHKLLIDDFGMGHTSMIYLQTNLFDYVKLDGSITKNILTNKRNSEIISSIVYLSQTLNFSIISEYVETEKQKEKLHDLGCNIYQGYFYSKPVKFSEFIRQLDKNVKEYQKND